MNDVLTGLDAEELLHLALKADDSGVAIAYLKRALVLEPENARVHYMLGGCHADIGLHARAIDDMKTAVALEPTLYPAQFQLGLLYLTSGRVEEAKSVWQSLDSLGEGSFWYLFARGMLSLAEDKFQACIDDLTMGVALNGSNEALNVDMRRVIDDATKALETQSVVPDEEEEGSKRVSLAAYMRNEFDQNH